jgi:glucose 1-dehydrogenase
MELAGKRAIVTGAGVRVGRALTLALAGAGCHVLAHYHGSEGPAREVRDRARQSGVSVELCAADLRQQDAAATIMGAAEEHFGGADILINNAAVFMPGGLADTSWSMWHDQTTINLTAPFFLCQAFAAQLPPGEPGRVVNIGDARTMRAGTDHLAYRLTKNGLLHMTELLALELAPHVTVNAVALGFILPVAGSDTSGEAYGEAHVPLRRVGSPELVVDSVLYLLRQPFTTGAVLRLDGGEYL